MVLQLAMKQRKKEIETAEQAAFRNQWSQAAEQLLVEEMEDRHSKREKNKRLLAFQKMQMVCTSLLISAPLSIHEVHAQHHANGVGVGGLVWSERIVRTSTFTWLAVTCLRHPSPVWAEDGSKDRLES